MTKAETTRPVPRLTALHGKIRGAPQQADDGE